MRNPPLSRLVFLFHFSFLPILLDMVMAGPEPARLCMTPLDLSRLISLISDSLDMYDSS